MMIMIIINKRQQCCCRWVVYQPIFVVIANYQPAPFHHHHRHILITSIKTETYSRRETINKMLLWEVFVGSTSMHRIHIYTYLALISVSLVTSKTDEDE